MLSRSSVKWPIFEQTSARYVFEQCRAFIEGLHQIRHHLQCCPKATQFSNHDTGVMHQALLKSSLLATLAPETSPGGGMLLISGLYGQLKYGKYWSSCHGFRPSALHIRVYYVESDITEEFDNTWRLADSPFSAWIYVAAATARVEARDQEIEIPTTLPQTIIS